MDLTSAMIEGYYAEKGAWNPYLWSSPASMGWNVGRYLAQEGRPKPMTCKMSRGFNVRCGNVVFGKATTLCRIIGNYADKQRLQVVEA